MNTEQRQLAADLTVRPYHLTWAASPPVGCYHRTHQRHLLLLLSQTADTRSTILQTVESWVYVGSVVRE